MQLLGEGRREAPLVVEDRGAAPQLDATDMARAVVEQPRCDALIREPEPVNPRVDAGEPRVPFSDSDEVGSGDGRPR